MLKPSKKGILPVGIITLLIMFSLSCSLVARLGDKTPKEWTLDQGELKTLINDTTQGIPESERLLQTIDRVEFHKTGGLKVYGTCPFANSPSPEGDYAIALITQDNRVRMEVNVGNTCGFPRDDPRVEKMNDLLTNALWEKITADCGKVLVNRIEISANKLTVWYVKSL